MSIFDISLFGNEHVLKQGRHLKTNKVVELSRRAFDDPHALQHQSRLDFNQFNRP